MNLVARQIYGIRKQSLNILEGMPTGNLISYYAFNDSVLDGMGVNNGTPIGLSYTSGKIEKAGFFNGSAEVSLGSSSISSLSFTDGTNDLPFSISFCIKFDTTETRAILNKREVLSTGSEYQLLYFKGSLRFELFNVSNYLHYIYCDLPFTPVIGKWYHLVFTYDGSELNSGLNIYVNSIKQNPSKVLVGTYTGMTVTASKVIVGRPGWASTSWLKGSLDGLGFWNKELTQTEISNIYNIQFSNPPAGDEMSGIISIGTFTHASSIDANVTGLYSKYAYDTGTAVLPIVVIMHGIAGSADNFDTSTYQRLANYGFFVLGVSMRQQNGATGVRDLSARELHDIIDAVEYVKSTFASKVNANKISLVGYSGGGGNVLGALCKFPDYFNLFVDHFGMSDYGYNTDGWYQTNPDSQTGQNYQTVIVTGLGGTPSEKPNEYRARNTREAINNFGLLTPLYVYHDSEDPYVSIVQSRKIDLALGINSNKFYNESTIGNQYRWIHALPNNGSAVQQSEQFWKSKVFSSPVVNVPDSATIKVIGYIKTKRFSIWLGNGTASDDGKNRTATVSYNLLTDTYVVTPHFESGATSCTVKITQGTKIVQATITQETTLIAVQQNISSNLISYYNFNDNVLDSKGANNGTLTNITYASGKSGNAAVFNGSTTSKVTLPDSANLSFTNGVNDLPFSISMYVKFNNTSNQWLLNKRDILSTGTEYQFIYYQGGFRFDLMSSNGNNAIITNNTFTPVIGQWYHVVFTYNASKSNLGMNIYVNGALTTTQKQVLGTYTGMQNTVSNVVIGQAGWTTGQALNGALDGLAIFNKELSQSEVTEIYNTQNSGNELI